MKTTAQKHYVISSLSCLAISIILVVVGFCIPPRGEIHPSVLEAVGILFLYPALAFANKALEENHKATITHNNTTITIEDEK